MRLRQKDTGLGIPDLRVRTVGRGQVLGDNYTNGRSFLILNRTAQHGMNNFIFHANTEYHHVDTYKAIFTSDCSFFTACLTSSLACSMLTSKAADS